MWLKCFFYIGSKDFVINKKEYDEYKKFNLSFERLKQILKISISNSNLLSYITKNSENGPSDHKKRYFNLTVMKLSKFLWQRNKEW